MTSSTSAAIIVALIFVLAGGVKGLIGLGLPTVAMGLLSLFMPPAAAAAILLLPSFVTNVWQLSEGPRLPGLVRRLWPTLLTIFVSTVAASSVIADGAFTGANQALGGALLIYAIAGWCNFRLDVSRRAEAWLGPLVGALTGVVTGMTGVFVIPAVPYLAGLGLTRDELVQALGLSFTVSTVALAIGLFWHDTLQMQSTVISAVAVIPALFGMALGGWLRRRVAPERFRRWFFIGLAALALHLLTSSH